MRRLELETAVIYIYYGAQVNEVDGDMADPKAKRQKKD